MGQRSRKRRRPAAGAGGDAEAARSDPAAATPPLRGEARNAQVRTSLEPLAEGERPAAVTVAAVVAVLLAAANLALYAAGVKLQSRGTATTPAGVGVFAAVMLLAAGGMWRARYWAVLGFEALLALTVLVAALSLVRASNLAAVTLCLAIIGLGGWLFWKLVRAMARIQMPERRLPP